MSIDVSRQRLAFIDLDGTLYRWSFYVDLIEQLKRFQKAMPANFAESQSVRRRWDERLSNEDAYLSQVIHEWEAKVIVGLSEAELALATREVLRQPKNRVYIFTCELIAVLKEQNYRIVAIGGSPKMIVQELTKAWSFDEWFGTEYLLDLRRVVARDQTKAKKIDQQKLELVEERLQTGEWRDGSIALGDTVSDWTILKAVEHPMAFNTDQGLFMKARQTGIPVIWERKNVMMAYRTRPADLGIRDDAFLFHEVPWKDFLPADVAQPLTERLRALDHSLLNPTF